MRNLEKKSFFLKEPNNEHMAHTGDTIKVENDFDNVQCEINFKCIKEETEDNGVIETKQQEEIIIKCELPGISKVEKFSSVVIKSEPNNKRMAHSSDTIKIEHDFDNVQCKIDSKCIRKEITDDGIMEIKQEEIIIKGELPVIPNVPSNLENVENINNEAYSTFVVETAYEGQISTLGNSSKIQNNANTNNKRFFCNLCDFKTSWKNSLKHHVKIHTGDKPFSCNTCGYKTSQKSRLTVHVNTHTEAKPFSCNLCGYKSSWKHRLMNHIKTHTGEKPFSCNLCKFKTSRKDYLLVHMRTHTKIKPFSCNLCEHKTSHKCSLIKHMRIHTGEKPFTCELCDYKSTQQGSLKSHTKNHH